MTNRHPFTVSQWQELEHQALFFKFMVSGLPIPPDLIFNIKQTTSHQSKSQSHHIGLTCFQLGDGIDQDPSRCRRTDGKKWRCSRYTTGDSKYCERHMHRGGKNRPISKHQDPNNNLKQLQNFVQESASAGSGNQSNSNISSITTHSSSKDSIFLSIEELSSARDDKREMRIVKYHQFIEESPESGRDSWLKLVI